MRINILGGRSTLIDQFISEIRDHQIQLDRLRFRTNLQRLGEIMAYEISKHLPFVDEDITTPLGIKSVPVLNEQPIISTIFRAGIPFHQGFLNYFDHADSAFIGSYRKYEKSQTNFKINVEYISCPSIHDRILIITDPMLATGESIETAYKSLLTNGGKPKHTHIAAIIASKEGIEYIERKLPNQDITLWACAVDDALTVKSYIVPGLGDAGDLAYGTKN